MKLNIISNKAPEKKDHITDKVVKHFAHSIFQTLKEEGCEHKDIIGVSSQLISLVTSAIEENKKPKES